MPRPHLVCAVGLAVSISWATAPLATAGTIAADELPLPNRVARAPVVVVGKVTAFEDKPVMAAPAPGAKNVEYKIAVLTVSDALRAPKGTKTLRLGFVPPPPGVIINPRPFQATMGQEGCFFLRKHSTGDFYVPAMQLCFVNKAGTSFAKELALIKRCTTILGAPDAALKGKDTENRFLAAAMLVARYRTRHSAADKMEPLDAEKSKLILRALADADWTPSKDFTKLTPLMVLHRLGLTNKDGFMPTKREPEAYAAYARQWVRDHADTYRIQKFVAAKPK
jgi:hypothetical protein